MLHQSEIKKDKKAKNVSSVNKEKNTTEPSKLE